MKWSTRMGFSTLACIATIFVAGLAFLVSTPRASQANTVDDVLSAKLSGSCDVECFNCGNDMIAVVNVGDNEGHTVGTEDQDCHTLEGGCASRARCNISFTPEAEGDLLAAVRDGNGEDIRAAIERIGPTAQLNVAGEQFKSRGAEERSSLTYH